MSFQFCLDKDAPQILAREKEKENGTIALGCISPKFTAENPTLAVFLLMFHHVARKIIHLCLLRMAVELVVLWRVVHVLSA